MIEPPKKFGWPQSLLGGSRVHSFKKLRHLAPFEAISLHLRFNRPFCRAPVGNPWKSLIMVTRPWKVNFISLHLSFNRPFLQGTGRKIMIQGLSRIFLPVPCKKGRLKLKWSEIGSNGARCLSFLKECPLDTPKSEWGQPNFFGWLETCEQSLFSKKKTDPLWYILALAVPFLIYRRLQGVTTSAGTLLWIYRRLIGRSYIALARQDQYIGNILDPLGRPRFWLFWYLLQCCICICKHP